MITANELNKQVRTFLEGDKENRAFSQVCFRDLNDTDVAVKGIVINAGLIVGRDYCGEGITLTELKEDLERMIELGEGEKELKFLNLCDNSIEEFDSGIWDSYTSKNKTYLVIA